MSNPIRTNRIRTTILDTKVVRIGATYEQKYKHILEEFVEYCNNKSEIMKAKHLNQLLTEFIHLKMERYK